MKKCPYCAEEIQDETKKCKHCGEWLELKEDISKNTEPVTPEVQLVPDKAEEKVEEYVINHPDMEGDLLDYAN